jgi:hypothetical protein
VVVVQTITSSKHGDVWVQDSGGGQYSGIHLFCNYGGGNPNCPMNKTAVEAITRGMVVNVTGNYKPFTPSTPPGAPTLIEIDAPMITAVAGMTGTPTAIDAPSAMVAKDAPITGSAPFQGTYIKVSDATFTVSSVTATEYEGTCPVADAAASNYFGVEASGGGHTLGIGLVYFNTYHPCLGGCFTCTTPLTVGEHFSSVSGILEPDSSSSNNDIWLNLSPTVDSDTAP